MNGGSTAYTCPSRLGGCCALCSGRSVVSLELRQSASSSHPIDQETAAPVTGFQVQPP
jgi:hypothetical protein